MCCIHVFNNTFFLTLFLSFWGVGHWPDREWTETEAQLDKAIWVERGRREEDTQVNRCADIRKLTSSLSSQRVGWAVMRHVRPEEEDSFPGLHPLLFLGKGAVMTKERFFLSTGSKEIAQSPARMCSPNCLTGPPISTYFASPPTSPFYISQTPSPLSLVRGGCFFFCLFIFCCNW